MGWKLSKWNDVYTKCGRESMTNDEIDAAILYLRQHKYPRPEDCSMAECSQFRPACAIGFCKIAVDMCGDF